MNRDAVSAEGVRVRVLPESELQWAYERYAEIRFAPSPPVDFVAVAEVDGERVGLGRLDPVSDEMGELGGIYVLPACRGRGAAAALVSFLVARSSYRQLFCIPFRHLAGLYRGFGFEPVLDEEGVPAIVSEKVRWCEGEYSEPVTLLVRIATLLDAEQP